jgi:hypothetical protein
MSIIITRIRVKLTIVCVESTLCVRNHTLRVKSHCAGGNCTLHVKITLGRVNFTCKRVIFTRLRVGFYVSIRHICGQVLFVTVSFDCDKSNRIQTTNIL